MDLGSIPSISKDHRTSRRWLLEMTGLSRCVALARHGGFGIGPGALRRACGPRKSPMRWDEHVTALESRRWAILPILCLTVLIVVIDNTIVNVALPTISRQLHASTTSLQWVIDAYSLPFCGCILAAAGISERAGRKKTMQAGLLLFAVFSAVAAWSHSTETLIVARALMGVAAALTVPSTFSLVTAAFTNERERAKAYGAWAGTGGVAGLTGPIVGGALMLHFWYGSIFLINVPIIAVMLVAVQLVVPDLDESTRSPIDVFGLVEGTASISLLVLAIIQGPAWGWTNPLVVVFLCLAMLIAASFVRHEHAHHDPLLQVRLFAARRFATASSIRILGYVCIFGYTFLLTQYFQIIRGYSPFSAGLHSIPPALCGMTLTPLGALAALRFGTRTVVTISLLLASGAFVMMTFSTPESSYFGFIMVVQIFSSGGMNLSNAPLTSTLMSTLSGDLIKSGSAVNEVTVQLGATMGVAVMGSIFSSTFIPGIANAFRARGLSTNAVISAKTSAVGALAVAKHLGGRLGTELHVLVFSIFMQGFHRVCIVISALLFIAALLAFKNLGVSASSTEDVSPLSPSANE
ncbi:MAG: MFS transporter [Acidimicrobiales bacterium]